MYIKLHPVVIDMDEAYANYLTMQPAKLVHVDKVSATARILDQEYHYSVFDCMWWNTTNKDLDYAALCIQLKLNKLLPDMLTAQEVPELAMFLNTEDCSF